MSAREQAAGIRGACDYVRFLAAAGALEVEGLRSSSESESERMSIAAPFAISALALGELLAS